MKKKEIKKTKLKPRSEVEMIENQNGVILKRMEHKFDLLSEGFSGMRKDIKKLEKKVDNNHKETNSNFKTLFEFRSETNDNFKANFEYLSKIDDEIQSIKKEMAEMKINMDEGIDPVKFLKLERRVGMIEKKLLIVIGNN